MTCSYNYSYNRALEFEWDEAKRQSNLAKHGIDFVDVELLFDGRPTLTVRSAFTGEVRFLTTGIIDQRVVTAVWTIHGESTRLISARRARDGERRAYRETFE